MVVATPNLPHLDDVKQGLSNIHVLARLRQEEGKLKPMTDLMIEGEDVLLVSTPLGTNVTHAVAGDLPLTLTHQQDPNGVVAQFVHQRNQLILEDNQVDVYLASHLGM